MTLVVIAIILVIMKPKGNNKTVRLDTTCVANACLAHRVRKLNRVISKLYDTAIRHLGITVGQMNLLVQINELANANGVARPSELGPRLQMEISTLSRTLDRLRAKGFINILRDEKDGRAQQLHLTSKAYELLRRGIVPWEKAQQKATQLLGSGGVALIYRIDQAIDAES